MTVKELKKIIETLSDDFEIVISAELKKEELEAA